MHDLQRQFSDEETSEYEEDEVDYGNEDDSQDQEDEEAAEFWRQDWKLN